MKNGGKKLKKKKKNKQTNKQTMAPETFLKNKQTKEQIIMTK